MPALRRSRMGYEAVQRGQTVEFEAHTSGLIDQPLEQIGLGP